MRSKCNIAMTIVVAGLFWSDPAWTAVCPKGQVSIRANTPVRKGPGLNYGVSQFLETSRCAGLEQASMDGQWTLVKLNKSFGWVLTKRLNSSSQRAASRARAQKAPIGSGQERTFAQLKVRAALRTRPRARAKLLRLLLADSRVLLLRLSKNERWAEVRDDRGTTGWVKRVHLKPMEALELPRVRPEIADVSADGGEEEDAFVSERASNVFRSRSKTSRAGRWLGESSGITLVLGAAGGAYVPMLNLDSDGQLGTRRYEVSALSGGAAVDIQVLGLGPLSLRGNGVLGLISGLTAEEESSESVGGSALALSAKLGWPIQLGATFLTPELGYAFDSTNLDNSFPDSGDIVFLSSETHSGLAGLRYQMTFGRAFLIEADLSVMVGTTSTGPRSLGSEGGLALGGRGALGLNYVMSENIGMAVQYRFDGYSASWSGPSTLDETITEATLSEIRQALLLGLTLAL